MEHTVGESQCDLQLGRTDQTKREGPTAEGKLNVQISLLAFGSTAHWIVNLTYDSLGYQSG